jgi:hypothetical protein
MSVTSRYVVILAAWSIGAICLIGSLIRIPLLLFSPLVWVGLLIGLLPMVFFDRNYRMRYACFCLLMSGIGGLAFFAKQFLNCLTSPEMCSPLRSDSKTIIAASVFTMFVAVGAVWFKSLPAKKQTHEL